MNDSTSNTPRLKLCKICGEEKPLEAFSKDKHQKSGHDPRCKSCRKAGLKAQKPQYPEGHKECTKCKRMLPHAMFVKEKRRWDGFYPHCKDCQRIWHQTHASEVSVSRKARLKALRDREHIEVPAEKVCCRCHEQKPKDCFYSEFTRIDGLRAECKDCLKKRVSENIETVRRNARKWRQNNTERSAASWKAWYLGNKDKRLASYALWRTRQAQNGGSFTDKDIAHMRAIQQGHCCYCGRTDQPERIDHILPVIQGGPSDPWNLALCCPTCNSSKGGRTPEQWREAGRWFD